MDLTLTLHLQDQKTLTVKMLDVTDERLEEIVNENSHSASVIFGTDKTVCLPCKQILYIECNPMAPTPVPLSKQPTDEKTDTDGLPW